MDLQLQPPKSMLQKFQSFSLPSSLIKKELTYSFSLFLLLSFLLLLNLKSPLPLQPLSFLHFSFSSQHNSTTTCDYSHGTWIRDENYSKHSYTEQCSFLDPGFRCHHNGRKDNEYRNWRWQPHGCELPRFDASELLDSSRNRRIVFAGDSIGRNQWESLVCMLAQAVSNHSTIYEQNGSPITKHKGYLSIRFDNYNLTVEYYRVPFLVNVGHPTRNFSAEIQRAIKVDELHWYSKQWTSADVLVFNAGHWWNEDKTVKMGFFFEEGGLVNTAMDVMEAFQRSLQTWKSWVIQNLDPAKSHVFFRSYSPVHFRNGTWTDGGTCNSFTLPETNNTNLDTEPWNNPVIYKTVEQIKDAYRNVQCLNITYLTDFRKDGHPANHRENNTTLPVVEDCSHWCLPGVPDTWNEILYAQLLSSGYITRTNKR